MDFLETIESLRAADAGVRELFGGEGRGVRSAAAARSPRYTAALAEAAAFLADVWAGRRPLHHLREALTTSDFPQLFGDILDRSVLAAYREWPAIWPAIAQRRTVRDFRTVKLFPPAWGADTRLTAVAQDAEYPEASVTEQAPITFAVQKYGRRIAFSWETIVNDDLDQFKDIPERFGRAARRTESRFVTELYVDANGPHASLYSNGNKNLVNVANGAASNNPPLSIAALQDGMTVLAAQVGENGEPIMVESVALVVPPALEVTARNILNATQIWLTQAGGVRDAGAGQQQLIAQNWMQNKVQLVVDPYIPLTATTNGSTSWFLFADPNAGRPALTIAFLRGHEEPEIFIREPNARRAAGGAVDPLDGNFETDAVDYKVRHVLGGARVDPRATVASNGSGA